MPNRDAKEQDMTEHEDRAETMRKERCEHTNVPATKAKTEKIKCPHKKKKDELKHFASFNINMLFQRSLAEHTDEAKIQIYTYII